MAKRPAEDDEDEIPQVRKRRRPQKKTDDDEDASSPPQRRGKPQDEDEEDEDPGISTGNVFLDIALDFRDDCIDWSKQHVVYAVIISIVSFVIFGALAFFVVYSCVRYLNRPSLETVVQAYDLGLFPETKFFADEALRYISRRNPAARAPFVFFQGAALCAIAERVSSADQREYYLTAANYLKEAALYNFFRDRIDEGWFLLGKSLFHSGEMEQCRLPLRFALDEGYPHTKRIYWYLAHAYFLGASPDLERSLEYLRYFQNEPTALEEEIAESRLLETMIILHLEDAEAAEHVFALIPRFPQFNIKRTFVEGQIEFFKGQQLQQQAIDLENDPNPSLLRSPAVAPVPVTPSVQPEPEVPEAAVPVEDIPSAPAPVLPMDEETLQQLMIPDNFPAPVWGMFDNTSEIQRRFAEMRAMYADDMSGDEEIIILPRQEIRQAPVPPPSLTQEIEFDTFGDDPILRLASAYRKEADEHYRLAIEKFSEVVRLADLHDLWGRAARLLIGICYMKMGDTLRSDVHFRRLIDTFPLSHEAAAASFFLGEQERKKGNADAALRFFVHTFETLRLNQNYVSLWLPREEIDERCIAMVRRDMDTQNYADAIQLLNALFGVLPADVIARLRGETYERWAAMLQAQADVTFGERGNQLAKEAESRRRSAGGAFASLAQLHSDTLQFTDLLWRAAENYRIGKDFRRAAVEYRKLIRADITARRPEINLRLGEMFLNLDILDEATYVLEEALRNFPAHHLVPQIRLVLSHVYSERQEWDQAKALLQLNLIGDAAPISAIYRDSMYALGKLSYLRGDLDSAIHYLEDSIKVHPHAVQAAEANYTLARAYLFQADQQLGELAENPPEAVRRSLESIVQMNRHRALTHLEQTEITLTDRQRGMGLTESERLMLRNVQFTICSVLIDLEQYEQAISRLNAAATMYQDRPEALDALVKLAFCLRVVGRETESQMTLRRAEVILNQLERIGTIPDGTNWRNVIQRGMER